MNAPFISKFLRDHSASAGTEMALMLPMLFALLFTMFEGGNYMWTEHKVLKGVRDGARYAARLPFEYYDCASTSLVEPTTAGATSASTRESEIKNLTRTGKLGGGSAKVPGWGANASDVTISVECSTSYGTGLYSSITGGAPTVTVSTVVPYPSILGLLGFDTTGAVVRGQANAAVTGL